MPRRPLTVLLCLALLAPAASTAAPAPAAARSMDAARASAVAWAVRQAGVRERGTSNCSALIDRWTRRMGLRVPPCRPWCGSFVHEAFRQAGVRLSARLIDPDRSYGDARRGARGLRAIPVRSVRRGDLLFFRFRPGLRASHVAIARGAPRRGRIATVEGNVGHAVRLKLRGVRYPVLAARVGG
jgi:cell wall-associated NlpC family hydrolase